MSHIKSINVLMKYLRENIIWRLKEVMTKRD